MSYWEPYTISSLHYRFTICYVYNLAELKHLKEWNDLLMLMFTITLDTNSGASGAKWETNPDKNPKELMKVSNYSSCSP
jgi:hypothetical protein